MYTFVFFQRVTLAGRQDWNLALLFQSRWRCLSCRTQALAEEEEGEGKEDDEGEEAEEPGEAEGFKEVTAEEGTGDGTEAEGDEIEEGLGGGAETGRGAFVDVGDAANEVSAEGEAVEGLDGEG
jgi:hypothetical protein